MVQPARVGEGAQIPEVLLQCLQLLLQGLPVRKGSGWSTDLRGEHLGTILKEKGQGTVLLFNTCQLVSEEAGFYRLEINRYCNYCTK